MRAKMERNGKLKIAICFFGHLRTYKECAPFLHDNFFKYYDYDLFMHTWASLDHGTKAWHNLKRIKGEANKEEIIKTYGEFKGIKIEEQIIKDIGTIEIKRNHNEKGRTVSIFGIMSMFYSMRESLMLQGNYSLINNIHYDYVVFIRPDIWIKKPLMIPVVLESLSDHQVQGSFFTLCSNEPNSVSGFEDMGGTDLMFFAQPEVISHIINGTDGITQKIKPNMVVLHPPEYFFIKLVEDSSFIPHCINFPMFRNWEIRRASESIKFKKRIISLRVRKNLFRLWLFPNLMHSIAGIRFDLFGIFTIDFSIGDPGYRI